MSDNCGSFITPIFENDPCNGERIGTGCIIDSNIFSQLGLGANSTQEEFNQSLYVAFVTLKNRVDAIEAITDNL